MYETFLPGKWVDNIDVNDFVNLNKIPFLGEPYFLEDISFYKDYKNLLTHYITEQTIISIPNEKLLSTQSIVDELLSFSYDQTKTPFLFNEKKSFDKIFNDTASTDLKNSIRMGLLEDGFGEEIPPIFFPDIRQLSLYGLTKIINEKRKRLKQTNDSFQTGDWIEKRIDINNQIESLEKFNNKLPVSMKRPSKNIIEILNNLLHIILHSIKENPSVTFQLPSLIQYIDIFIEKEIQVKNMTDKEANQLVAEFYTKILIVHYHLKSIGINFIAIETIFSAEPTKTTYRFLSFYESLGDLKFPLTVIAHPETPNTLDSCFTNLIKNKSPIRFIYHTMFNRNQMYSISHLGFPYDSSKDVILYNKPCDLIKLFFITLNGGKDIETNYNLFPVYQRFKTKDIDYDLFYNQFKEVTSIVFTLYAEANNLLMYLSERYFSHSFRNAFKDFNHYYFYYFNFLQIDKLARNIVSIKRNKYEINKDERGFIIDFNITYEIDDDEVSKEIEQLTFLFKSEMRKIPFYQLGKPRNNFILNEKIKNKYNYKYKIPTPDDSSSKFIINRAYDIETYRDILDLSRTNILDIQI